MLTIRIAAADMTSCELIEGPRPSSASWSRFIECLGTQRRREQWESSTALRRNAMPMARCLHGSSFGETVFARQPCIGFFLNGYCTGSHITAYIRRLRARAGNDQRDLNYAIVDEVDSILIDEARTPLIISGSYEVYGYVCCNGPCSGTVEGRSRLQG